MRVTALLAGLYLMSGIFLLGGEAEAASPLIAQAESKSIFSQDKADTVISKAEKTSINLESLLIQSDDDDQATDEDKKPENKPAQNKKPKVTKHTVQPGETLSKIADEYDMTWERIFNKNTNIGDPNVISVGDEFVIPQPEEKLEQRVPAAPVVETQEVATVPTPPASVPAEPAPPAPAPTPAPAPVPQGSSAGNTYYAGYCTWYAKSRRPDLPNNLGNANTWVAMAAAQGFATGSTPRVGAIGQQGMHVVYVEAVHGNGTVTVSEMNFNGWNVVSSRTVPASTFMYIY